jgi:hypothetical protein
MLLSFFLVDQTEREASLQRAGFLSSVFVDNTEVRQRRCTPQGEGNFESVEDRQHSANKGHEPKIR